MPVKVNLNRLPTERGHTQPDPCTNQHRWLKCDPSQRWEEVGNCRTDRTSVAYGFFWWFRARGLSPDSPDSSKTATGPVCNHLNMRVSAWRLAPWGLRMPVKVHLDRLPAGPTKACPSLELGGSRFLSFVPPASAWSKSVFVIHPTIWTSVTQGFLVGPDAGP